MGLYGFSIKKKYKINKTKIIIKYLFYLIIKGEKLQDAYFTFQEQADKNVSTSMLLNSQALCLLNQAKYEEAASLLQESLDKVKFLVLIDLNSFIIIIKLLLG